MDVVDKKTRSRIMSKIKSKGTKPEKLMKKLLNENRIHFISHDTNLPGKPDFLIQVKNNHDTVIMVDGCFWHCCPDHWKMPKSNRPFWQKKFDNNFSRDMRNNKDLLKRNLKVIRVWECELRGNASNVIKRILSIVKNKTRKVYYVPTNKIPQNPKKQIGRC